MENEECRIEVVAGEDSWNNSTFSILNSTFGMFIGGELVFSLAKTMNTARKAAAAKRWKADILRTLSRNVANTPAASSLTHNQAKTATASNGAKSHCTATLIASVNSSITLS